MTERSATLRALWERVNDLGSSAEDPSQEIRYLIAEAGIAPKVHVGRPPEDFDDPDVMAEYVLGQWAACLDSRVPFMNTVHCASVGFYEKTYAK